MAKKFDPFEINKRIIEQRGKKDNSENAGTRIIRLFVGLVSAAIVWSLISFYDLPVWFNTASAVVIIAGLLGYGYWVFNKK